MSSLNPQGKTNRIKIYQASFDFKNLSERVWLCKKAKEQEESAIEELENNLTTEI